MDLVETGLISSEYLANTSDEKYLIPLLTINSNDPQSSTSLAIIGLLNFSSFSTNEWSLLLTAVVEEPPPVFLNEQMKKSYSA